MTSGLPRPSARAGAKPSPRPAHQQTTCRRSCAAGRRARQLGQVVLAVDTDVCGGEAVKERRDVARGVGVRVAADRAQRRRRAARRRGLPLVARRYVVRPATARQTSEAAIAATKKNFSISALRISTLPPTWGSEPPLHRKPLGSSEIDAGLPDTRGARGAHRFPCAAISSKTTPWAGTPAPYRREAAEDSSAHRGPSRWSDRWRARAQPAHVDAPGGTAAIEERHRTRVPSSRNRTAAQFKSKSK